MYTIYHIPSTMAVGPSRHGTPATYEAKSYAHKAAALRTARAFNAKMHGPDFVGPGHYGVATEEHYRTRVVRMVERTNLRTGTKFQEPSNTPGYCSPSSEAYWSA